MDKVNHYNLELKIKKLEEFLSSRGFKNIHNVISDDYKKLYCLGKNVNRKVSDLLLLAHAEVLY